MTTHTSDDLDLHAYTVTEALEKFVAGYNARVKNHQCECWKIIHGYGSSGEGGVIRTSLRAFLDRHQDKLRYETGDSYGNPGWTFVYPQNPLPDQREQLALEILNFCKDGKPEEKILGRFGGQGGVKIKELVRSLVKQGRLKSVNKGSRLLLQAPRSTSTI